MLGRESQVVIREYPKIFRTCDYGIASVAYEVRPTYEVLMRAGVSVGGIMYTTPTYPIYGHTPLYAPIYWVTFQELELSYHNTDPY